MALPAANLTTTEDLSKKTSPSIRVFKRNHDGELLTSGLDQGGVRKDHFALAPVGSGQACQRVPRRADDEPGPAVFSETNWMLFAAFPAVCLATVLCSVQEYRCGLPGPHRPTPPSDLSVAFDAVIHYPAGVSSRGLRGPRVGSACAAQVAHSHTPALHNTVGRQTAGKAAKSIRLRYAQSCCSVLGFYNT
ncbi:BQ5605_C012g06908 [Microbotryum silenes-dioicae]|uniref:BQ5605_C012g06908 protein n=1 Tax=Microbotryum silenes-dioicae TaxID=796604 RepID=A0A2X0LSP6_9BASI|nr:BQ5605_C012g06908 [Microbotryum silenes-dioicae]